jgi:hypothetical protein
MVGVDRRRVNLWLLLFLLTNLPIGVPRRWIRFLSHMLFEIIEDPEGKRGIQWIIRKLRKIIFPTADKDMCSIPICC